MCRIQDCDPWDFFQAGNRTARKAHQCYECSRTIEPGEEYHCARGKMEGRFDQFKLCAHCDAASDWLSVVCNGFLYGGIGEELREHWEENPDFRSIGLGRLIHGIERRWRRSRYATGLMEVPTWAEQVARATMAPIWAAEKATKAAPGTWAW